jgi:6-phosphofructokinase
MGKIGIVVSGGPAPGINSVISSVTIAAQNKGIAVVGFQDGFSRLASDGAAALLPLTIDSVSRIHDLGGSILGTSRFNPFREKATREEFIKALGAEQIDRMIVIGGDGSAYLSSQLRSHAPHIQVIHVPKTIDNDIDLPNHHPSFGFETARDAGTSIVSTIGVDAKTCQRWFLLTVMGRRTGFLALGLGIAAGATRTVIPEQYPPASQSTRALAEDIYTTIRSRRLAGKPYGVILIAEGLLDALDPAAAPEIAEAPRDELGRIKYSHIELGEVLQPHLEQLSLEDGAPQKIISKNIGYELRCHPPTSFDIEYTRFLGHGAVHYLTTQRGSGEAASGMVVRNNDHRQLLSFESLLLPDGSIRSRRVDLTSDTYQMACQYMVR